MNSYNKLIENSAVFAIGNFGSKIISFILVPIYTYYLTTSEYGTVDLITTTTSLLLPIVSANIFDSVLRFAMDKDNNPHKVLTNSIIVSFIGFLIFLLFLPIVMFFVEVNMYILYMYLILLLQIVQTILGQYTRAIGQVKVYAFNGIIMTLLTGFSNIFLLVYFQVGLDGYLWSIIIANIGAILYLSFKLKVWQIINFYKLDMKLIKEMLIYSVPIIPNSIMWWLINSSSRYFVLFFVGASGNGIYAVANKIPNLLSMLNSIFSQAWQLSAIEEYGSEKKSEFYSTVYNTYSAFLLLATSVIILLSKIFMEYFVAEEYYVGFKVIPFLLLSVVFSSLSAFLGTNYLAAKKTKGVFKTSIYGGIVSLLMNIILIPNFGILGASISSMISFIVMWGTRIIDTKKFVSIKISIKNLIANLFCISLQITLLFISKSLIQQITIGLIILLVQMCFNRNLLKLLINLLKKVSKKINHK